MTIHIFLNLNSSGNFYLYLISRDDKLFESKTGSLYKRDQIIHLTDDESLEAVGRGLDEGEGQDCQPQCFNIKKAFIAIPNLRLLLNLKAF